MSWMLDTNACVRYLNGRAPTLRARIQATNPADLVVCSIVKAELFFGARRSVNPTLALERQRRFLAPLRSLSFGDAEAETYGMIRALLATAGTPIGPNDLLIASIALSNGVTLVTHNVSEFSRVPGLVLEDWEQ
jgi:tRNA(fMet)-specific endonuclease VapC